MEGENTAEAKGQQRQGRSGVGDGLADVQDEIICEISTWTMSNHTFPV